MFLPEASLRSLLHTCEQQRPLQDCVYAQARFWYPKWYPPVDLCLAIWTKTKSRAWRCLLRPRPRVVWCSTGFRVGPILFLIFINDLPDNINSTVRLFADDCVLYRNIRGSEDQQLLQDDLEKLALWEKAWLMKFNVAKCHSVRVTKHLPHKQIVHGYLLHNQVLENVPSAKYLGVQITDDLDWGQHINEITSKATKTLGFLRRNMAFASRETKAAADKTLIRPKLEYAAPVWMPHHQKEIDRIEKSSEHCCSLDL